jgi:hypothetical protein
MKWFKNDEINPSSSIEITEGKKIAVRFAKKKKGEGLTLFLSKDLLLIAEENGMTHLRFGFDSKKSQLLFQLNKNEQGLALLNKNKKYRNLLNAGRLVELFQENGVEIPLNEKLELEIKDKTTLFYPYDQFGPNKENDSESNEKELTTV